MKTYDLVISDSLAELIETTNEAYSFGYLPVGGMLYIESQEKFIQTIIKLKTKNHMNTFFQELAKAMKDSEIITLKITKVGEELTVLLTSKGKKDLVASGTPLEMDNELLGAITTVPEKTGFKATVIEPDEEEEEENEDDKKEEKPKSEKKTPAKKEVKGKTVKSKDVDNEKMKELQNGPGNENESGFEDGKIVPEPITDKHPNATAAIAKAHEEGAKATEAKKEAAKSEAKKDNEFTVLMHEGKRLMAERKYSEAFTSFEKACSLSPENVEAQTECAKAGKWVKMVADL